MPQLPQLAESELVSVQPLGHAVPEAQVHLPALQFAPLGHAFPQVPQFLTSVVRSTQPVGHGEVPAVAQPHLPPLQFWPGPQALPHDPQFKMLVEVSTQPVGQAVSRHWAEHAPLTQ